MSGSIKMSFSMWSCESVQRGKLLPVWLYVDGATFCQITLTSFAVKYCPVWLYNHVTVVLMTMMVMTKFCNFLL